MEKNALKTTYGIGEENLTCITELAKDYAIANGILMKTNDLPRDAVVPLPFCLVPTKFPEKMFKLACDLQPYLNLVLFKVSLCKEFLKECLSSTIEADEFTANIYRIYETVLNEKEDNDEMSLGLIRSDYLLNCDLSKSVTGIKQVENNTIAASFGGLSPAVRKLHEFILTRLKHKSLQCKLPANESVHELAKGLVAAWDAYGNQCAVILIVVEDRTLNICDQRVLEYAILKFRREIEVLRYSFKDLRASASLKGKKLFVKDREVAVVYYRIGYMPENYAPEDWDTRLLMERSSAIKCPSAGLHLAGTKRVQLQLSYPGVLEKFVDSDVADKLRQVFVNQYSLDQNEEGDKAVTLGIENPEKYVLKPEREGGGNNIYGEEIKSFLEGIKTSDKRKAYILMERIFPPAMPNCIVVRNKPPSIENVVCELGIFGVILGNIKCIKLNNFAGHLLRSKGSSSNETGVAAGFGALDSPYIE